ncbi:hypothetical protein [Nonomuraea sp. NPDC049646]|uniref:hypothetical protein n=1 Tax=unclassified Nonomuraea TaxID=2593643 RepID=UPI0037AA5C0F
MTQHNPREPRYTVHHYGPGHTRIYDGHEDRDVATLTSRREARAVASGLNSGTLHLSPTGDITDAPAGAGPCSR